MLYLYKKTTSTGTTIGITEATSERHLAERVLAAIPEDETIIALSGDALPEGLITLPALMDAIQELMAKEDNAHAHAYATMLEDEASECDGDCANCDCDCDCEEDDDFEDEDDDEACYGGEADDFLTFLKKAISDYEERK